MGISKNRGTPSNDSILREKLRWFFLEQCILAAHCNKPWQALAVLNMEVLLRSRVGHCLKNQKVAETGRFRCDSRTYPPGPMLLSPLFWKMIFRNSRGEFPRG